VLTHSMDQPPRTQERSDEENRVLPLFFDEIN
jgi:hypothetical protein